MFGKRPHGLDLPRNNIHNFSDEPFQSLNKFQKLAYCEESEIETEGNFHCSGFENEFEFINQTLRGRRGFDQGRSFKGDCIRRGFGRGPNSHSRGLFNRGRGSDSSMRGFDEHRDDDSGNRGCFIGGGGLIRGAFDRGRGGDCLMRGGFNRGRGGDQMRGVFHRGRGGDCVTRGGFNNGIDGDSRMRGGFMRGRGGDCFMRGRFIRGRGGDCLMRGVFNSGIGGDTIRGTGGDGLIRGGFGESIEWSRGGIFRGHGSWSRGCHDAYISPPFRNELEPFEGFSDGFLNYMNPNPKYEFGTKEADVYALAECMKEMPKKENDIQNLENAVSVTKLCNKPQYSVEMLMFYEKEFMFTGTLYLSDVFLARGVGKSKKDTKRETYRIAYEVLTRKPVEEIVKLTDPGVDMVRAELLNTFGEEMLGCSSDEVKPMQAALSSELEKVQHNLHTYGDLTDNPISCIELHLKKPGIHIKSSFNVEMVTASKGHYFVGELKFNDVLIATGEGMNKKAAKSATYEKALEYLKTISPQELGRGRGINAHIQVHDKRSENATSELTFENTKVIKEANPLNLETQLSLVIAKVTKSPPPENFISALDGFLVQCRLSTVILIKSVPDDNAQKVRDNDIVNFNHPCTATLHVNSIVIAERLGANKKEAQEECYKAAWEVFNTTSVDNLLSKFPHRDPMEDSSSDIIDIVIKGKGKHGDSNLERLIKMNSDVFQKWRPISDLIIVESHELTANRRSNAFLILYHSATFSGMLLEWSFDKRLMQDGKSAAGCYIRLQHEIIGQAVRTSKNLARNEACLDILRKYYFTQTVIQKLPLTEQDINYSVGWALLHEEVALWKPKAQELVDNMSKVDSSLPYTKEFRESALFQYILHLSRIAEEKMVGSLVLGVDFPDEFKRMLYVILDKKGWRLESKKNADGSYLFINVNRSIREIAALLEEKRTRIVNQYCMIDPTTVTDFF